MIQEMWNVTYYTFLSTYFLLLSTVMPLVLAIMSCLEHDGVSSTLPSSFSLIFQS
jgi:hypothetical protein